MMKRSARKKHSQSITMDLLLCVHQPERESKKEQAYMNVYEYVSVRDCSFRSRNITRGVFVTINSQIKKIVSGNYFSLNPNEVSVESQVEQIENDNENAELIVIKSRDDMSDTEAVFYCIRNALAHGAFEIKGSGAKNYFCLRAVEEMFCKVELDYSNQMLTGSCRFQK